MHFKPLACLCGSTNRIIRNVRFCNVNPSSSVNLEHFKKIQDLCERWPKDTCGRTVGFKSVLTARMHELFNNPHEQYNDTDMEQQFECLSNIINNDIRDKYVLSRGLGQSLVNPDAPLIAATGANLDECRKVLINEYKDVTIRKGFFYKLKVFLKS